MGKIAKIYIALSLILIGLLATSCGAVPGAKECDTVVNSFMTAGDTKDVDGAHALFYNRVKEDFTLEDLGNFILNNYELFQGFQKVKMRGINVTFGTEGDVAQYQGEAEYSRDFTTWVEAELVKEADEWKLWIITITPSE